MKDRARLANLRHLRMFETVARFESVSRASALINRSQPAVTQAISSLEERFGTKLFERGHSGSYLTPSGEILLARTERLFSLIREALEELFGGEKLDVTSLVEKITATHIRCLLAVADNQSFEQAARSIGVS